MYFFIGTGTGITQNLFFSTTYNISLGTVLQCDLPLLLGEAGRDLNPGGEIFELFNVHGAEELSRINSSWRPGQLTGEVAGKT